MPFCKWQGRVADDSPPSSAEVKNVWGCTSSPPHAFMVYTDKTAFTFTCCFIHRHVTLSHALEYTLSKFLKHDRQKRIIRSFTTVLFALYHYVSVIKSVRIWLAEDVESTQEMLNSHNNLIVRREEMRPDGRSICMWHEQTTLRCWLDASGSEYGPVVRYCGYDKEPSSWVTGEGEVGGGREDSWSVKRL